MTDKKIVYNCTDNPPPSLGQVGSKIFEMSGDRIGPIDQTAIHKAAATVNEVYKTLKHYLALHAFMVKYGVLIQNRGHLYIDLPRLQDVATAISRKKEPGPVGDPSVRLKVLRSQPFEPATTLGDAIRRHQNKQKTEDDQPPAPKTPIAKTEKPMATKKQYVLFMTPSEAKAWSTLVKLHGAQITLECDRHGTEISVAQRLVVAGHMETMDTDTADTMAFRFATAPAAFHVQPIDERKTRRMAAHWLDLIERILKGEFTLPTPGALTTAFNDWARSVHPQLGKGSAYVMLVGFAPERKYDHLGLIIASPDRQSSRSGEFLMAVRGFTAYDFMTQDTDSVQPGSPAPERTPSASESESTAPATGPAMTRKSAESVCVTLLGEEDMAGWSVQRIEAYCLEIDAAVEKLTAHRRNTTGIHAQAMEREIKKLEDEATERLERADALKKRLKASQETPSQQ